MRTRVHARMQNDRSLALCVRPLLPEVPKVLLVLGEFFLAGKPVWERRIIFVFLCGYRILPHVFRREVGKVFLPSSGLLSIAGKAVTASQNRLRATFALTADAT